MYSIIKRGIGRIYSARREVKIYEVKIPHDIEKEIEKTLRDLGLSDAEINHAISSRRLKKDKH